MFLAIAVVSFEARSDVRIHCVDLLALANKEFPFPSGPPQSMIRDLAKGYFPDRKAVVMVQGRGVAGLPCADDRFDIRAQRPWKGLVFRFRVRFPKEKVVQVSVVLDVSATKGEFGWTVPGELFFEGTAGDGFTWRTGSS